MLNLPTITEKQREIIKLIYSHRYLNRIQIQAFLKHKDYKTINLWLKDLRQKHYLEWIYSTDFAERTKPAIYYLGLNGIRHLKTFDFYEVTELRKRYRDSSRSQTYIDRCLLLADCAVALQKYGDESEAARHKADCYSRYHYETEADYLEASYYHFLADNELIHPHLCFSKLVFEGGGEPTTAESYLLEIFDPTLPRYRVKKRLENYVAYLEYDDWSPETERDNLPIILLVCPRTSSLIYAKRKTRGLLLDIWEYDDAERPHIRFTTAEKLDRFGITSQDIWEEA